MDTSSYQEGDGLSSQMQALGLHESGSGRKVRRFEAIAAADVYESTLQCLNEYLLSPEARLRIDRLSFIVGPAIKFVTYKIILGARRRASGIGFAWCNLFLRACENLYLQHLKEFGVDTSAIESIEPISKEPWLRLELDAYIDTVKKNSCVDPDASIDGVRESRWDDDFHTIDLIFEPLYLTGGATVVTAFTAEPSSIETEEERAELKELLMHLQEASNGGITRVFNAQMEYMTCLLRAAVIRAIPIPNRVIYA